jgi:hypothetical protein
VKARAEPAPTPRVRYDTSFAPFVHHAVNWQQSQLALAHALIGFFKYYSTFDFESKAISIFQGGVVDREQLFVEPPVQEKKERKPRNRDKAKGKGKADGDAKEENAKGQPDMKDAVDDEAKENVTPSTGAPAPVQPAEDAHITSRTDQMDQGEVDALEESDEDGDQLIAEDQRALGNTSGGTQPEKWKSHL